MAKRTPAPALPSPGKPVMEADFDLTALTEHPDNPRTITAEGRRALGASMQEFGVVEPIVANRRADGTLVVVGGHQRLRVLLDAGTTRGPVSLVQLDPVQEKRLLVMLNGHHGQWDQDKLSGLLVELSEQGVVIEDMGLAGVAALEEQLALSRVDEQRMEEAATGAGAAEVAVDDIVLKHRCPKCGFEYAKDVASDGSRGTTKHGARLAPELEDDEAEE